MDDFVLSTSSEERDPNPGKLAQFAAVGSRGAFLSAIDSADVRTPTEIERVLGKLNAEDYAMLLRAAAALSDQNNPYPVVDASKEPRRAQQVNQRHEEAIRRVAYELRTVHARVLDEQGTDDEARSAAHRAADQLSVRMGKARNAPPRMSPTGAGRDNAGTPKTGETSASALRRPPQASASPTLPPTDKTPGSLAAAAAREATDRMAETIKVLIQDSAAHRAEVQRLLDGGKVTHEQVAAAAQLGRELGAAYHPGWSSIDADSRDGLLGGFVTTLWHRGPAVALSLVEHYARVYELTSGLSGEQLDAALRMTYQVLSLHHPRWLKLPEWERHTTLVRLTLEGAKNGGAALVARARALEAQRIGSVGASAFHRTVHPVGSLNAFVISYLSRGMKAPAAAYWSLHDAGSAARFFTFDVSGGPSTGTYPLPWAGKMTIYLDLHGLPEVFISALDNPRLGDLQGDARVTPDHFADLTAADADIRAVRDMARARGEHLHLVLFSCSAGTDGTQAWAAAPAFVQRLGSEGITVWASQYEVATNSKGQIRVMAPPNAPGLWKAFHGRREGPAQLKAPLPFVGAISLQLVSDSPWRHPVVPSPELSTKIAQLRRRDVHLVTVWRSGPKAKLFVQNAESGWSYRVGSMKDLARALRTHGLRPGRAVVLAMHFGAHGQSLTRPTGGGKAPVASAKVALEGWVPPDAVVSRARPEPPEPDAYGLSPAQLLADELQVQVIAPAGWVEPAKGSFMGGAAQRLEVTRSVDDEGNPRWEPWVIFNPRTITE
ncbi:hypothetical protein [Streptomyces sp. NPDC005125]